MIAKPKYLALLLLLSFFVCSFIKDDKKQVVCFGDSITYGARVDGRSWVTYLKEIRDDYSFINAGRSGRKTSDKKELIPVLEKYPNAHTYMILLGVNDLKDGNDSLENVCVNNIGWMIDQIKEVNPQAHIVVLSPCNINLKTMDEINVRKKYNKNTQKSLKHLQSKYRHLAKEKRAQFISLFKAVSKPNYTDGLHPDAAGQKEIAKAINKSLL